MGPPNKDSKIEYNRHCSQFEGDRKGTCPNLIIGHCRILFNCNGFLRLTSKLHRTKLDEPSLVALSVPCRDQLRLHGYLSIHIALRQEYYNQVYE